MKKFDKIRHIINEEIDKAISDEEMAKSLLRNPKNEPLWRIYRLNDTNSIFENGYSCEYFGDGEGTYHGWGLYCFYGIDGINDRIHYCPQPGNARNGSIGDSIMQCVLIGGFKDFLIFDGSLAKKYYGTDDIKAQIDYLYSDYPSLRDSIYNKIIAVNRGNTKVPPHSVHSGHISKALWDAFGDKLRVGKTKGVVYNGTHDHHACVVYNTRTVVPIAYTTNRNLTQNQHSYEGLKVKFTKEMFKTLKQKPDYYSYGQKLKAQGKIKDYVKDYQVNNCIMVTLNNGNHSAFDTQENKFISKYGFSECVGWQKFKDPERYNKPYYFLPVKPENGGSIFYLRKENDGKYYFYYRGVDYDNTGLTLKQYDNIKLKQQSKQTKNSLNEDYQNGKVYVYHRTTNMKSLHNIFEFGMSAFYSNVEVIGHGVYCSENLNMANTQWSSYGNYLIRLEIINGYKDFLINNEKIAKAVYGKNWRIEDQLRILIPNINDYKELAPRIMRNPDRVLRTLGDSGYDQGQGLDIAKTKIRGVVANQNDGRVVCRIWNDVIPIEYSVDNGKTWRKMDNSGARDISTNHRGARVYVEKLIANNIIKDTFRGSKNGLEVNQQFINGYVRVELTNGKISFYSIKDHDENDYMRGLISKCGFDEGYAAQKITYNTPNGEESFMAIPVKIDGDVYYIYKDNNEYYLYVKINDAFVLHCNMNNVPISVEMWDEVHI